MKVTYRLVLVLLAILLGLIVCSYLIISYHNFSYNYAPHDRLEILYVAANLTSREIFCKVRNTGNAYSILEVIRVNGSEVSMVSQLPMNMEPIMDYKTCVFRYDGPWKGSMLIDFYTTSAGQYERWGKLVDLQTASSSPIEGAYPSGIELLMQSLYLWFGHHEEEIARYMERVLWGSVTTFEAAIVVLVLSFSLNALWHWLRKRGYREGHRSIEKK